MQLFYEIFPVFLFFIAFKFYDIYVATMVGIVTTFIQVVLTRIVAKKWDHKQLITLAAFSVFGGMTLYFHNPIFVKWKPTVVFWIFSVVILGSQFIGNKPMMQRLFEPVLEAKDELPPKIWQRLNVFWSIFFASMGLINIVIAYHYSNEVWVNFKFYGISAALFLVSILQALYLVRFIGDEKKDAYKKRID